MTDYGCKVCRVLDERGLERFDDRLLARWHGKEGDRMGYRSLARWLNVRLLTRELERAGFPAGENAVEARYDHLRGDEHGEESRRLLREAGVPVDELRADFVSYGVVRTHLLDCLDEEPPETGGGGWEEDAVAIARERTEEKAFEAIRAMVNRGDLVAPEVPTVDVRVELACPRCGETTTTDDAFETGVVCDCSE